MHIFTQVRGLRCKGLAGGLAEQDCAWARMQLRYEQERPDTVTGDGTGVGAMASMQLKTAGK